MIFGKKKKKKKEKNLKTHIAKFQAYKQPESPEGAASMPKDKDKKVSSRRKR